MTTISSPSPAPSMIAVIPTSHLDLFWLGDYRNCLARGDEVIRAYIDRALESGDETFVIDTTIFAEHFLDNNPQYEEAVRRLLAEKRLEIGAAYIDRWENLVLGESLIRNIQIGRRWARDRLGIDACMAAHPDLPGLNAQTSQIYAQAGVRYYVTSRKIFHEGRVWRHRAPDGTAMTMLTWPIHYVFVPFTDKGLDSRAKDNFVGDRHLSMDDLDERYPHGTVAIAGSAGDLTDPDDFATRYGKDLREYIEQYREEFPNTDIRYSTPGVVLEPYLAQATELAEVCGSLPSVWGVAADEEMRFFHRVRELERILLAAESASVLSILHGSPALPAGAAMWRGLYAEDAFFASNDYPPPGREWELLWRMHVFTQDHNGGGQDGPLSIFQKKVRHDRTRKYAAEVFSHALEASTSHLPTLLRVRLGSSENTIVLDPETATGLQTWLESQPEGSWQAVGTAAGTESVAINVAPADGVGHSPLRLEVLPNTTPRVTQELTAIHIETDFVAVVVDNKTGSFELRDKRTGQVWSKILDGLHAVPECGNDVTLKTDEAHTVAAVLRSVELAATGPLAAQVRIVSTLLDVNWVTVVTVWAGEPRVDVDVTVQWPAYENWQIRLPLYPDSSKSSVYFGTPFHGSRWDDVPDEARTFSPDEIDGHDYAKYREVQQWLHLEGPRGGLTIATRHPAFHHDGSRLSAVLLRTPASCGDRRMFWTNPGETSWNFELHLAKRNWLDADAPERADRSWRRPLVFPNSRQDKLEALRNLGDTVQLSAFYLDDDGTPVVRLVNQADNEAHVVLAGEAVHDGGELIDLDGTVLGTVVARDGRLGFTMAKWKIQTIRLKRAN